MGNPLLDIKELIKVCKEDSSKVIIWQPALEGAAYFGLTTHKEIKAQIGNGLIEEYEHITTRELDVWPKNKKPIPMVESYDFHAGTKFGYIAYFKKEDGKWSIKSLKKNDKPNPKNYVFKDNECLKRLMMDIAKEQNDEK